MRKNARKIPVSGLPSAAFFAPIASMGRATKGLHGPSKGLFLAKPKGFRILFLLHLRSAADFLSAVLYNLFCLSETFLRFTFPFVLYFYLHTYPQENPHSLTLYLDSFLST